MRKKIGEILRKYQLVILLFVSIFLMTAPAIQLWVNDRYFIQTNDYIDTLPLYYFQSSWIRIHRTIPTWNPYVSTGISTLGDPTGEVLNPVLTPLMVFFGVEVGILLSAFIMYWVAGFSMWYVAGKFGIAGHLRLWVSLLYMTAGNMAAYFASGSIPKLFVYPIVPLVFFCILKKESDWKHILVLSLLFSFIFYAGYPYFLWFTTILLLVVRIYYVFVDQRDFARNAVSIGVIYVLFILFSALKLIPYITQVSPIMARYFPIDPYLGSIHFFYFPFGFIVPLQVNFYDRPFFRRMFDFYYNWHEYYAFISIFPFVFFIELKRLIKYTVVQVCIILLITGALYISLKYPYSPFYWLYHTFDIARNFRVPQRIYEATTVVMVLLTALCAKEWFKTNNQVKKQVGVVLCLLTILSTTSVSFYTLYNSFEPKRTREEAVVRELRKKDASSFYVAVFTCCLQTFLVKENIPIINFYYSWRPKYAPNFLNEKGDDYNYDKLYEVKPRYVFANKENDFTKYAYKPFLENDIIRVWKTGNENIKPKI